MKKAFLAFLLLYSSFLFAQNNNWLWANYGKNTLSGPEPGGNQNMVTVDNLGNFFYIGVLQGNIIQFGSYTLMNSSNNCNDIFLVKFDPYGNVLWAKQSQQNDNEASGNGYVVSTDAMGNAYIMANFYDTISFDGYMLTTQPEINGFQYVADDIFFVKYDPNGNAVWARQSQVPSYASDVAGNSLATDKKGNSYITGLFHDTVSFGAKTIIGFGPTFLVSYDASGNVKWAEQSTGHSTVGSEGDCVTTNSTNGIFISGRFFDSVTFGSYKLMCPPTLAGDGFLVKYDTNGNVLWAKQSIIPSSHNFAEPRGVTTDNFGNAYVTGLFWDTLVFGIDTLTTINYNIYLVKYDSNGNVKWAMCPHILDNNNWGPTTLSSDNKGDIFLAGGGGATGLCKLAFGTDTLSVNDTSIYDVPSFIIKFDSSGKVLCSTMLPCGGSSENGAASDTSGNYVYYGGTAATVAIFGKDTINPFNYNDDVAFVARWEECDPTLGVNTIVKQNIRSIMVFPNPSNGQFTIQSSVTSGQLSVQVYNMLGEMVLTETLPQTPKGALINISNQPNGVYLYRAITNTGSLIGEGKLIIQK